jgi:two-component system, LytTR family, response regulator
MKKINCLIVDDEPIARDIIIKYCETLPYLEVAGTCGNSFEAKAVLMDKRIDILFLDIHMPVLDGIGFLTTIKDPPQVIFTTAFKEHAATAFDLAACDYLVKPFSLERFMVAVDKAMERIGHSGGVKAKPGGIDEEYLSIKTDGKIYRIRFDDLLYAEASGNYTKLVTNNGVIMPGMPFSGLESLLPPRDFIRVHRSFVINKSKITYIQGNVIYLNKQEIPIGQHYKDKLLEILGI